MTKPIIRPRGIRFPLKPGQLVGRSDGGDGDAHPITVGDNLKLKNRKLDTDLKLQHTHVYVGDAQGQAKDVALSGDASILDTGAMTVTGLQTVPVANTAPTNNYVLTYDSGIGKWKPAAAGSGYTDEQAQDAVGNILTDTATIDFTYDDATPKITADIKAASVTEAMQVLADNTTNDVSTSKHGYAPKLPNDATKYLDGTGGWSVPAGGGGGSWTKIATSSPTSTNTLTFNSLGSHRHLKIIGMMRSQTSGTGGEDLQLQFNSDTTAGHYADQLDYGNGTTAGAQQDTSSRTYIIIAQAPKAGDLANDACYFEAIIPFYALTTFSKKALSQYGYLNSNALTGGAVINAMGIWNSTAAITAIALTLTGNFVTGSTFDLYAMD